VGLKLVGEQLTLIYGMRLYRGRAPEGGAHAYVEFALPDGRRSEMALHTLVGSRDEIREQLRQSIDAFFELIEPEAEPDGGGEG
jgi:hypothetical protein